MAFTAGTPPDESSFETKDPGSAAKACTLVVPFVIRVTYFQVATERERRLHVEDHETVAAGRALWEWLIRRSKIVHEHSLDQLVFFMFVPVQKFKEMEDLFSELRYFRGR